MALTITSRGTGTHNTGATTLVPGGRSATLAVGSLGVLCIALDNQGGAGDVLIAPNSWTDAKGNVWTLRQNALYDNGAASAGVEMAIYTAPITVALLTTDLGTMTWKTGVSPVAKAWTWYEVIPSGANTVAYSTGGTIAGATAANAQVVTASVLVGDGVIAGYFSENVAAVTGDSDTTNGTWTAQQTATVGTTTSGVRIATQQKVQTTTASTQSYDVTVTSQDRIAGYVMLHEVVNTTVTPSVLAIVSATFAPTVTASDQKTATPGLLALTTASFASVVTATVNQLLTPAVLALATSSFAPTVTASDHKLVTPGVANLTSASFAPTIALPKLAVPDLMALALTAFAPFVAVSDHKTAVPAIATLSTASFAPTVSTPVIGTPPVLALSLTAFAPSVEATDHKTVVPSVTPLTLTTFAPSTVANNNMLAIPPTASLVLSTFAPAVTATNHVRVIPATASVSLTALAPVVSATANVLAVPGTKALTLVAFPPTIPGKNDDLSWVIQPVPGYLPVRVVVRDANLRLLTFGPRVQIIDDGDVMALLQRIA